MKPGLTLFSLAVLAALIGVSIWATGCIDIMSVIRDLTAQPSQGNHPWFVATLFDAYFGFLWFWLWVAYKETAWTLRLLWLAAILFLGNIAMATYMLLQLRKLAPGAGMPDLLLRRT